MNTSIYQNIYKHLYIHNIDGENIQGEYLTHYLRGNLNLMMSMYPLISFYVDIILFYTL